MTWTISHFRPSRAACSLRRRARRVPPPAPRGLGAALLAAAMLCAAARVSAQPLMDGETWFARGDHVAIVGGASAERMQRFGYFEALLTASYPDSALTFRNLAWSGDEVALRPRPLNFGSLEVHLAHQRPDVALLFFGTNESFAGPEGLDAYRDALRDLIADIRSQRFNAVAPPRIMLVSPAAQEEAPGVAVDIARRNRDLALYAEAMRETAEELGVGFTDLFESTRAIMQASERPLTFNGMHFNAYGHLVLSGLLLRGLGLARMSDAALREASAKAIENNPDDSDFERLRAMIAYKNEQFFYRYRPVNGEYVYGRRRRPFGVANFPAEMEALDAIVAREEERIQAFARTVVRPEIFPSAE